ncbi:TolB family protein [Aliikangiella sp. IMCC44653]
MRNLAILTICSILFSAVASAQSQPDHDIIMFDFNLTDSGYSVSNPVIVANSAEYENQPHFSPDGTAIWFTKMQNGLTDIWIWNEKGSSPLHPTPLSEFSPTMMPFKPTSLSSVRVEKDGSQRLWEVDEKGQFALIFNQIQPVGYHAWSGKDVAMFILGEPNSLQVTRYGSKVATIVDDNIGRCIARIPGKHAVSYTKHTDQGAYLLAYDFTSGQSKQLISMPQETQDYAWINDHSIVSSLNDELVIADLTKPLKWQQVINASKVSLKGVSRIAYSAKTQKLAVVVEK